MAVDLQNRDSLMIPSQFHSGANEILFSTHDGTKGPVINKRSSYSSFGSTDLESSMLSSPVESELGSTSTDSESDQDEDYVAELTRQMAHSMLQDDDIEHKKKWDFSGFIQSTPQSNQNDAIMGGNFEDSKRSEEMKQYNNFKERFFHTSLKPNSGQVEPRSSSLQSKQALIDEQIRAIQLFKLKQQQIIQQQEEYYYWGKQVNVNKQIEPKQQFRQFQSKVKGFGAGGFSSGHQNSKVTWSNFQQQQHRTTGSEMRAVFLNEPGSRTGSCGTGVFLPRGIGNTSESRKKPGCSTVLIPAKVVQALKLHFDRMDIDSRPSGARNFLFQHDDLIGDVRYGLQLHQKSQSETVQAMNYNQENGLPNEWTY